MSNAPSEWLELTLGEVADWGSGGTPTAGRADYYGGDIPWAVIGDLDDGPLRTTSNTITGKGLAESSAKIVPEGSVLIAMYGSIGKLGLPTGVLATNQVIAFAVPKAGVLDRGYLFWYLMYQRDALAQAGKGVAQKNISQTILKAWPITFPPIDEQRRIVAILEDHLSRLEVAEVSLKGVLLRADGLETALLSSAFLGRVIGEGMESSEIKTIADARRESWERAFSTKAQKPPLSIQDEQETHTRVDWPLASLDAVTDPVRTIRYGILMPRVRDGGEVPYVEVKDLLGDTLEGKVLHRTSRAMDEQFSGARIRTGDLLHAVRGSYDRSAVVPIGMDGTNISRDVVRIVPLPGISPHFLHYWMRSPQCKAYMTRHARGVAVKGVNIESLRQLPVPLASTAAQEQVVEQLSKEMAHLSQMCASARRSIERASGLRRALLAAAFSGQLTKESSVV